LLSPLLLPLPLPLPLRLLLPLLLHWLLLLPFCCHPSPKAEDLLLFLPLPLFVLPNQNPNQ
jgi:hypothetical protein